MNEPMWVRFILSDFRGEIHLFTFLEVPVGNRDAHLFVGTRHPQRTGKSGRTWRNFMPFMSTAVELTGQEVLFRNENPILDLTIKELNVCNVSVHFY